MYFEEIRDEIIEKYPYEVLDNPNCCEDSQDYFEYIVKSTIDTELSYDSKLFVIYSAGMYATESKFDMDMDRFNKYYESVREDYSKIPLPAFMSRTETIEKIVEICDKHEITGDSMLWLIFHAGMDFKRS